MFINRGIMEDVLWGTSIPILAHLRNNSLISSKGNSMNKRETVQALMDAVQKGDFVNVNPCLQMIFNLVVPSSLSRSKGMPA